MADVFLNAINVQTDEEGNIVGTINKERMLEQMEALLTDSVGCIKFTAKKRDLPSDKGHTHKPPIAQQYYRAKYSHTTTHSTTPLNGHYKQSPEDERF